MNRIGRFLIGSSLLMALVAMITPSAESAPPPSVSPTAALLVTGLQGATGSTVGPDGALYVTEGAAGRISRVDPQTGELTTFASGLPKAIPAVGIGGAIDVAFIGRTAYVRVTLDGEISVLIAFDDIVPTGLAVSGNTIYMAEAGPVPHLAQNGKVVAFGPKSTTATEVAFGAPLLVDVEFGRGRSLYALSQGPGMPGA